MNRGILPLFLLPLAGLAQIDPQRATEFFNEAKTLCEHEGGKLWKTSLCGPIVFADPATKTIATNQPAPEGPRPRVLGFANTAIDWGGVRWTTISWPFLTALQGGQGQVMIHELFHRIQPQLGLFIPDLPNDHLDTADGRYWMQLEWKALSRALDSSGGTRLAALRAALGFRAARRSRFSGAAESERTLEINEGLAEYTATVVAAASSLEATRHAIQQLAKAPAEPTFVRQFAYPTGAAYGILLDAYAPGWTHRIQPGDDLGKLLEASAHIRPQKDVEAAAESYGGLEIRNWEARREVEQKAYVAALRRRFVDEPVLILPPGRNFSFSSIGMTPIPGEGTIYPSFRIAAAWGTLEASAVLVSPDSNKLSVPAPPVIEGKTLKGDGWSMTIAEGWVLGPGPRAGDFQLLRER
ncbi:hypothetical protein [Bryobacter aggregatus]|uniref:hypothetical protein n=1 Tax=Bryobacter aggregatus TaxID=360054 RepID=UPI00068AD8E1|nr:hypothetical protein [Bryobacter aggregatus]